MNYLGNFVSTCRGFYQELNSANLTGAIDVLVVQQPDGRLQSTPFHVRFGKLGVLRPGDLQMKVEVKVNGEVMPFYMTLDETGSAFFVEQEAATPTPQSGTRQLRALEEAATPTPQSGARQLGALEEVATPTPQSGARQLGALEEAATPTPQSGTRQLRALEEAATPTPQSGARQLGALEEAATPTPQSGARQLGALEEVATPTPPGEVRQLGGVVGGARSVSAGDEENTPTNSPHFEPKGASSFVDWSPGNTGAAMATGQSGTAPLQEGQLEEGTGTVRSKSVPSVTDSPVKQSSDLMLQSKQDGSREKDEDACVFELSDIEGSGNHHVASDRGGANTNESVGGRPANQTDEEVETTSGVLSHSLPGSYPLSDNESYMRNLPIMPREDPNFVHSDTELEMGPSSRATLSPLTTGEQLMAPAPPPAPARSDSFLRTMMRLFSRGGRGRKQPDEEEGLFLVDLETVFLPPEERSQYFPARRHNLRGTLDPVKNRWATSGDEDDSGVSEDRSPATRGVASAPCSPSKEHGRPTDLFSRYGNDETDVDALIATFEGLQLSLCGGLKDGASDVTDENFAKYAVTFEQFAKKPALLTHPDLVVKVKGQCYNWQVAAPLLMSILVFHRPLPQVEVDKLVSTHMRKEERGSWGTWFRWGRRSSSIPAKINEYRAKPADSSPVLHERAMSMSSDEGEWPEVTGEEQRKPPRHKTKRKKRKSLVLTEEQLECLNLNPGANEAEFSVTTMIQGTSKAVCSIYLWKSTDKIIVSDIDGTITRSDVAGQILPMLGKDWSHAGVVALFKGVADNGYKVMYLSARPIGYAPYTRSYLQGIRQGNGSLPCGPMFLAPLSVIKAFTKEVIEKKPEEFKIACLKEIRSLFPPDRNPFYAGFGNKSTDETSYKAVGIPTTQMYTVNPRGELKNSYLTSFKSSYKSLKEYIDHMFPPLDAADQLDGGRAGDEFSSLNFWRTPFSPEAFQLPEDVV